MIKRKCPECGECWYSACTADRDWECENCGAFIPKSAEEPANIVTELRDGLRGRR